MALDQNSTLLAAVQAVPDPRKARGKRYSWSVLLSILVAGLASNYQTAHAIAQWVKLQFAAWHPALPDLHRPPSASTLLRTLRQIDASVLEAHAAAFISRSLNLAAPASARRRAPAAGGCPAPAPAPAQPAPGAVSRCWCWGVGSNTGSC